VESGKGRALPRLGSAVLGDAAARLETSHGLGQDEMGAPDGGRLVDAPGGAHKGQASVGVARP
jgi:hypothetical protein